MAKSCLLSLGICLFILFHGCLAVRPYNSHQGQGWSTRPDHQSRGEQSECQINNLDALEPSRRIEAEAGQFEIWDDNNEQFRCAGVAAYRVTIQPKGLSLPVYHNQPRILYIVQGRGVLGLSIPGCPETFQLFQQDEQSEEEGCRSQRSEDEGSSSQRSKDQGGKSQQSEDQDSRRQKSGEQYSRSQQSEDQDSRRHKSESRSQGSKSQQSEHQSSTSRKSEDFYQQPRFFKEGDILMVPNGVSYWVYNDGDTPLVAIAVIDTRNNFNQLDRKVRNFWLAGNIQEQQEEEQRRGSSSSKSEEVGQESSNNVFSGFDAKILAQVFGVTKETVRKLQKKNDERGPIIQVERGLQVIKSISSKEQERQQETNANGLEETLCNMRLRQNIGKATSSDVYTPFGGRLTNVNSQSLPILGLYELSAERGHLYKNAIMSPHWNVNAHSLMYVLRGEARVQIVGNSGQTAYDGQLCEGQLIVIPQNFAVVKQAGDNGFEWVSIKTSDNAVRSPLVGRTSAIRAMPEEVLVNVYRISNEEARMLKYNREETCVLAPNFESNGRFSVM